MRLAELDAVKPDTTEEVFKFLVFSKPASTSPEQIKCLTGATEARVLGDLPDEEVHLIQVPRALDLALPYVDNKYLSQEMQYWLVSNDARSSLVRLADGFQIAISLPKSKLSELVNMTYLLASLFQARESLEHAEIDVRMARHYAHISPISGQALMADIAPTRGDASKYAGVAQRQVVDWLVQTLATQW